MERCIPSGISGPVIAAGFASSRRAVTRRLPSSATYRFGFWLTSSTMNLSMGLEAVFNDALG